VSHISFPRLRLTLRKPAAKAADHLLQAGRHLDAAVRLTRGIASKLEKGQEYTKQADVDNVSDEVRRLAERIDIKRDDFMAWRKKHKL